MNDVKKAITWFWQWGPPGYFKLRHDFKIRVCDCFSVCLKVKFQGHELMNLRVWPLLVQVICGRAGIYIASKDKDWQFLSEVKLGLLLIFLSCKVCMHNVGCIHVYVKFTWQSMYVTHMVCVCTLYMCWSVCFCAHAAKLLLSVYGLFPLVLVTVSSAQCLCVN